MLVSVFANPHSVACRSLQRGRSATFVKTHHAGFPLVNLTRHHVYWAERLVNTQLLRAPVPSSCAHVPVPRLLRYNDAAMRLTFEYVPRAPRDAIPDGSQILAQATCLRDFLVRARVTHGDIECKHLLWARRSDAAHLMLVDFDMATFEHGDWNATVREAAMLARIKGRVKRAQALLRERKLAKGARWFAEAGTDARSSEWFARFVQFVSECAMRRRRGLDDAMATKLLFCVS
jgi:hypothetical protein